MITQTDPELWNLIIGFLLPIAIAFVVEEAWDNRTKALIAFVISLAVGFGTTYLTGQLDPAHLVRSILVVFVTAISTYKMFWQNIGLKGRGPG